MLVSLFELILKIGRSYFNLPFICTYFLPRLLSCSFFLLSLKHGQYSDRNKPIFLLT